MTAVGIVSRTATYWPLYLMAGAGIVKLIRLGSTAAGVDALTGGRVDIAATCPDDLIASGASCEIAAGLVDRPPAFVVCGPGISTIEDLRGRRVGTTSEQGSVSTFLRALLRQHGLGRGDYVEAAVGPTPAQAAALERGDVDAAMLTAPFEQPLASHGFTVLADVGAELGPCAFTTINVRPGWTATPEWQAFQRGFEAAISRLADRTGRTRELPALIEGTGIDVPSAPDVAYDARVEPASIERLLGFMQQDGIVPLRAWPSP